MRTCQSVITVLLAIFLVSCQSSPRVPVKPSEGQKSVPLSQSPRPFPSTSDSQASSTVSTPQSSSQESAQYGSQGANSPMIFGTPPEPAASDPTSATTTRIELDDSKSSAAKALEESKKKPPIPPVIGSLQTGLMTPPSQEVPTGAPLPSQKERQRIVLNFDKADIAEVTSQIFGDQLKVNYVMDQTLQGRISMYIEGDFDPRELLQMVTRAYESNGVSVIPKKGFFSIQASQKTGGSGLPIATPSLLKGEGEGTRPLIVIYRLRYMDPKQASTLVTPFLSPGKKIIADPLTNSLIFVEETDNARSLINLLKTIDINILQEISMEIVPLRSIAPQDAVQGMESLMGKLGGFKDSALKSSLAFIPLQSFGGVLVMAQNPDLLKSAKQWIQALDAQGVGSTEEIYVYFVQNGLAKDISDILNSVFGLAGAPTARKEQKVVPSGRTAGRTAFGGAGFTGGGTTGGYGGISGSTFGTSATRSSLSGTTDTGAGTTGGAGTRAAAGTTPARGAGVGAAGAAGGKAVPTIFTGEVMIIPDEVNNAIVIRANAIDYAKIKKTLETLDILPRAVLIEVMIAEVQLTKDFAYGLQYWFQTHPNNQTGFGISFGGLSNNTSGSSTTSSVAAAAQSTSSWPNLGTLAGSGVALSWIANAQNLAVFLNALSSKTTVTVLSTPTLLATDNKEATITVGGREPVPTGSYTGSDIAATGIFSTIQYEETGVILNVTPHINAGGLVRLELEQIIRRVDATPATVGANNTAPRFTERNVKTTLLAQNGNTVVIGGIIDSAQNTGKQGIPFLENIPLISPLFSTTSSDLKRTELIVAITPHVIDQRGSEAPKELLEKLKSLKRRIGG